MIGIPARDLSDAEVEEFGGEKHLLSLECGGLPLYEKQGQSSRGREKAKVLESSESDPQPAGEVEKDGDQ